MDVLIAGGGTGGHLFPGIALAQEVRRRDPQARVLFVGTARGLEARLLPSLGLPLALLPVSGIRHVGARARARALTRLPAALWAARRLVRDFRPDVAVSVGGYAAGPAVLAAALAGVPCALMEQNAVAGTTTRLLAPLCRRLIVGLPCAGLPARRTRQLGNPVRAELAALRARPYAPRGRLRLLVLGGSQGARALNDVMLAALPQLGCWPLPPQILHQAGAADAARVGAGYAAAALPAARAVGFIDDMAAALADADLVLCRAGATTLAELTVCGRPALLVPYPFAASNHQHANARVLQDAGAARLCPQAQLTATTLVAELQRLAAAPAQLIAMAAAARALGRPDAAAAIYDCLAQEVLGVQE